MVISLGILILFCLLFILRQVLFNLIPFNSGFYSSILDFVIDVEFCLFRVPVYLVLVKPEYSTCSTSFTCSKYSATFLSLIFNSDVVNFHHESFLQGFYRWGRPNGIQSIQTRIVAHPDQSAAWIRRKSTSRYSPRPWSPLVEGDESSFLSNCQSIALDALFLLLCIFINTTAYHWADLSLHLPLAVAFPASAVLYRDRLNQKHSKLHVGKEI